MLSLPLSLNGQDEGYYYHYRYYIDPVALAIVAVALAAVVAASSYPSGDRLSARGIELASRARRGTRTPLLRGIGAYRGMQSNLLRGNC